MNAPAEQLTIPSTRMSLEYLNALLKTYETLTDEHRPPRLFEQGTAEQLYKAYVAATAPRERPFFETVSSATGGGKTKAAEALIALVAPTPVTFVIKEIREIDEVYCDLIRLLPEGVDVAMWDSVHRVGASRSAVREKEFELQRPIAAQFTLEACERSSVLLTTHAAWKRAVDGKSDREFVLRRNGHDSLVIVDEDPDLERTHVRQPRHIQALIELLSDVELDDEARTYGFSDMNRIVPALRRTLHAMNELKVRRQGAALSLPTILRDEDVEFIYQITDEELRTRSAVLHNTPTSRYDALEEARGTVEFLKAASEGRVFYSRDVAPAFYAYSYAMPAQPNTIILDGTADINGMFAASSHVHVLDVDVPPNYEDVKLSYVIPPTQFRRKLKPSGLYKNSWSAEPFVKWFFRDLLIPNTVEGDRVLVYAKQDLLAFNLQAQYDESGSDDPYYIKIEGRQVWFCHFGAGRGSNRWKGCNVCFRLSEFYPKKAVMISKAASMTNRKLTQSDLNAISPGTSTHDLYVSAVNTHLMVHNKQETARTCIRELDDDGRAAPARVYFVDSDLTLLRQYQNLMYPGSAELQVLDMSGKAKPTADTQRLLDHLQAAEGGYTVTYRELAAACEIEPKFVARIIQRHWKELKAAGYRQSSEKAERGSGRGKCLVRS